MGAKNNLTNGQVLTIAGGVISIISVFLPWFSANASALGLTSGISVNGWDGRAEPARYWDW